MRVFQTAIPYPWLTHPPPALCCALPLLLPRVCMLLAAAPTKRMPEGSDKPPTKPSGPANRTGNCSASHARRSMAG